MDPALLAQLHGGDWQRLSELAKRRTLTSAEASDFLTLYRTASKDLSRILTVAPDSEAAARLSVIVHRARTHLSGIPRGPGSALVRFAVRSLPAALYQLRWMLLGVTVVFLGSAVGAAVWALSTPDVLDSLMPPEAQRQLAEHDFVDYYKENPNSVFAVGVWTNNAWIAVQWVALGITGFYVPMGLVANGVNVGISAAVMHDQGYAGDFWSYILPHGIPEITCILIAAAAGMRIFLAWVLPRAMTRGQALAKEARSLITVAGGLVLFLFLSGLVEGFVTPNPLPVWLKIAIGVLLTLGIFAYATALGRPVVLAGGDGDLEAERAGYTTVAAY
ncbi:stage II sporulation protein M [Brevibacterium album]|uniref:stage II sporulation protein M n=1 Tax=Brevibacterium album TaxID=417948 RepID=UPI000414BE5D|nr:stage II sporulation protein M [Brevibacterium album]